MNKIDSLTILGILLIISFYTTGLLFTNNKNMTKIGIDNFPINTDYSEYFKENNFEIGTPKSLGIKQEKFAKDIFNLIEKSNNIYPQIMEIPIEKLKKRHDSSYIIYDRDKNKIIGSFTLEKKDFNAFKNKGITNEVTMLGLLVVDPERRGKGFGTLLLDQTFDYGKEEKELLLTCTLNPKVVKKRENQGFTNGNKTGESAPFKEYIIPAIDAFQEKGKQLAKEGKVPTKKTPFTSEKTFLEELTPLSFMPKNLKPEETIRIKKILNNEYEKKEKYLNNL